MITGKQIREARLKKGVRAEVLAKAAGININTLYTWETSGDLSTKNKTALGKVLKHLGFSLEETLKASTYMAKTKKGATSKKMKVVTQPSAATPNELFPPPDTAALDALREKARLLSLETTPRNIEELQTLGPFLHRRIGELLAQRGFPVWREEREKSAFVTASPEDRANALLQQLRAFDALSGPETAGFRLARMVGFFMSDQARRSNLLELLRECQAQGVSVLQLQRVLGGTA